MRNISYEFAPELLVFFKQFNFVGFIAGPLLHIAAYILDDIAVFYLLLLIAFSKFCTSDRLVNKSDFVINKTV
ncbi:hypothetical protein SDC9_67011 [bioreactor metagenome]|uniref:Uncharacterized protein n=1 Tax=bioreactor metagenome TaxID=1076179 RepID=A0A644XWH8_9ZZZZ